MKTKMNQTDSATSVSICAPSIRPRPLSTAIGATSSANAMRQICTTIFWQKRHGWRSRSPRANWLWMQKKTPCASVRSPVRMRLARQHLKVQHMDAYGEQQERVGAPAAATVFENEAESLQSQEKKSAAAELNNLNSCPVCCLNFYRREPKLLPCLHSFCKKCLPAPSRNLALAVPTNSPVDGVKPCESECFYSPFGFVWVESNTENNSVLSQWMWSAARCADRSVWRWMWWKMFLWWTQSKLPAAQLKDQRRLERSAPCGGGGDTVTNRNHVTAD